MNIALIGYGYWGKKVYKTLSSIISKKNIFVVEPNQKKTIANIETKTFKEILFDKTITQVFIATPEITHFKIAKQCLENNKNIFVEKPLCLKKKEAVELHQIAKKNNLKIYVDYIFIYDPYVKKISELIKKNTIGKLTRIESIRHSINISKPIISVFDDLAIHDIYLGKYFLKKECNKTKTIKELIVSKQIKQASAIFSYGKINFFANYSWIQPVAKRTMIFFGKEAIIVWDKNEKDLFIYKNQKLAKKIKVKIVSSPLELSIKEFMFGKNNYNYISDVKILEDLDKQLLNLA
ncbi:MAG: hypothetical protein AUJ41_04145 [Candidatus Pacebacteria bacterium CG1_02_43_31]|nr:MAG: hypothetical protein AUJ41_04145 [Candidatus Pacebacteria bacterium CG1_02_43_31]PJC43410.1 MAG: hypothetical protein CO039_04185 [Candidatus Pacebacteria bacterium CG_4_9_14_0_2_um_filter_34_50]